MITKGTYSDNGVVYGAIIKHSKIMTEAILYTNGTVVSAYKSTQEGNYSAFSSKAREMVNLLNVNIRKCTSKNCVPEPFELGSLNKHVLKKRKAKDGIAKEDDIVMLHRGELCGAAITGNKGEVIDVYYDDTAAIPEGIEYIKLTESRPKELKMSDGSDDEVLVRSVNEIALEKDDISWLKDKKYYIVNNEETAEELFSFLDNYNGVIAYDTETTGLKINCFGKINSKYKRELEKYNEEHPDEQIRVDRLVGIIFCVEEGVSYYFPCGNRKFKNLYEEKDNKHRKRTIEWIKSRYTVGPLRNKDGDMADYVRNTPEDEWTSDVIMMERVRDILETKHLVAHNSSFEWKTGAMYEIDTNTLDDTMILHQIMYKFRSTTSNRGESSALKFLAMREFGIEQWDLGDFFVDFKENKDEKVRGKKGKIIDFSYMDYDGTRIYAPADGDVTLMLFNKYKKDLLENHREQQYIYDVEVIVARAIGYMEFYGHRIDEKRIAFVRDTNKAKMALIESEIRQSIDYSNEKELELYNKLYKIVDEYKELERTDRDNLELMNKTVASIVEHTDLLNEEIGKNTDNVLNLASPSQVADLFYTKLGYPMQGDKQSVAKAAIKPLLKERDSDGKPKYPIVHLYSEYKTLHTLSTKFFDNLPDFMYPGGFIFSSYGQISTATGRMSCSKPNAQQYPGVITDIVVPREGNAMISADYSQIEYRVLVALSKNEKFHKLFADPDNDYHTLMASIMYGVDYASVTPSMRGDAKSFNFGIPFGMGIGSLAILLTGKNTASTRAEAMEKYELYFKDQPMTKKFFDQVKEMAQVNKYTKTFWNRYRYYSFLDKDGNESQYKKASALRQAGNAVIQGTAADIFKIGVARMFMYIKQNNLFGDLLIVNMIHDEQLLEVNTEKLNIKRVLKDIGEAMQFKLEGFPPLYIGAGVGDSWGKAKSSLSEIHPHLMEKLSKEVINDKLEIRKDTIDKGNTADVINYVTNKIYEFRVNKVKEYLLNEENHNKELHPAIGNLLNLQFSYGHSKSGEKLSDAEYTQLCLKEFIKDQGIDIDYRIFKADNFTIEEEEDEVEYDEDGEEIDFDDIDDGVGFSLIDDSNNVYGSSIHDIIGQFGACVIKHMGICGIDTRDIYYKKLDNIIDYLEEKACDKNDEGALQVVFLKDSNILNYTPVYVKGVEASELEARFKMYG